MQVDSGNGNVVSNKRMAPKQKKKPTKKTKKMEEQVEELKENLEEHVQDDGAHQIEEQLKQLKESLEEHVEDGDAHHFEEQLEKLEEKVEKKHDELKDKMEEGEESSSSSSEESEEEDDEGSTSSSSSDEEDGWLRGKMSGLFGSRTHFGSANPRQVQIQDLFADFFSPSPGAGRQWDSELRLQQKDGSKAKEEPNEENQEDC